MKMTNSFRKIISEEYDMNSFGWRKTQIVVPISKPIKSKGNNTDYLLYISITENMLRFY